MAGQHKNGGTPLRGNYAGIGMTYDEDNDLFSSVRNLMLVGYLNVARSKMAITNR